MAVDLYDVSLADVEGHLPGRPPFGPSTKPTADQAAGFIEQAAGWVATRVGPLTDTRIPDVDTLARARRQARTAAAYGAASAAEAAAHPERVNPSDAGTYAAWLWARFLEALDAAVELVDAVTPGDGPAAGDAAGAAAGQPAWSFPPPTFTSRTGF